jgi:hypothetical protein
LPDQDRTNPSTVLTTVLQAFGVVHAGAVARTRLYSYRRTTESVNEFAAILARRCFEVDPKMSDDERVSHFLRALDDNTAAHILRSGVPASLTAAVTAARNAEHAAQMGTPTIPTAAPVNRVPDDDPLLFELRTLSARLGALEASLPQPTLAAVAPPRPTGPIQRPRLGIPNRRDPGRDRWAADGTIICNICGQPGHKAIQCAQHPRNRAPPPPPPGPAMGMGNRPRFQ